jgi:hypothetical protein
LPTPTPSPSVLSSDEKAKLAVDAKAYGELDGYAIYFDPDASEPSDFFERYKFNYNLKTLVIKQSAPGTTFSVNGSYGRVPTFNGGLQDDINGVKKVFLTGVNLDEATCKLVKCEERTTPASWNVKIVGKQAQATVVQHSWGVDIYSDAFAWKEGDEIAWLTTLTPEKTSSLVSFSVRIGSGAWRSLAILRYPAIYPVGLGGGYGGINQLNESPFTPRTMVLYPTLMSNDASVTKALTNLYLQGPENKVRHSFKVDGSSLVASVGIEPQVGTKSTYRLQISPPSKILDFEDGKEFSLE